jgi:hypothetical protein
MQHLDWSMKEKFIIWKNETILFEMPSNANYHCAALIVDKILKEQFLIWKNVKNLALVNRDISGKDNSSLVDLRKTQSGTELTISDTSLIHFKPHLARDRQRWQFFQDRTPKIIIILDNFGDILHFSRLFLLNHRPEERMAWFMFAFHLRS